MGIVNDVDNIVIYWLA